MNRRSLLLLDLNVALVVGCLLAQQASTCLGQQTTYGEDPIPGASESFMPWNGYGADPVPHTTIEDHDTLRRAYGFDQVPTSTPGPTTVRENVRKILPNQTLQVLTGAVEGGPETSSPCAR